MTRFEIELQKIWSTVLLLYKYHFVCFSMPIEAANKILSNTLNGKSKIWYHEIYTVSLHIRFPRFAKSKKHLEEIKTLMVKFEFVKFSRFWLLFFSKLLDKIRFCEQSQFFVPSKNHEKFSAVKIYLFISFSTWTLNQCVYVKTTFKIRLRDFNVFKVNFWVRKYSNTI